MQSSPFLTHFPPEIRRHIYGYLLKDEVFQVEYRELGLKWHNDNRMSIAQTCHACRIEAIAVFQEQSVIQVDTLGILALKGWPGMFNRNRLRRIKLVPNKNEPPSILNNLRVMPPPGSLPPLPPAAHHPLYHASHSPGTALTWAWAFVQGNTAPEARERREEPDVMMAHGMLHCLDVFFDLNHLQLQLSVIPKLLMYSTGEPASEMMRDMVAKPSMRETAFGRLLTRDVLVTKFLETFHGVLSTRSLRVQDITVEVKMALHLEVKFPHVEELQTRPFGSITIDVKKRRLTWEYEGQQCSFAKFGWEK